MTTIKRISLLKTLLAGTAALAIAGTTFAHAQDPGGGGAHERGQHTRMSAEDFAAFADARIAAIRAGLKLTPEQEKNWPVVEAALRDMAKHRSERFAARVNANKPTDPIERLSARADAMTQRGATLKKLADAAGPLYKSLDDGQKRRLLVLARNVWREEGGWHGRHQGGRHHHGLSVREHRQTGASGDKQPQ